MLKTASGKDKLKKPVYLVLDIKLWIATRLAVFVLLFPQKKMIYVLLVNRFSHYSTLFLLSAVLIVGSSFAWWFYFRAKLVTVPMI